MISFQSYNKKLLLVFPYKQLKVNIIQKKKITILNFVKIKFILRLIKILLERILRNVVKLNIKSCSKYFLK
jgi:hypothetical protein